MIEAIVSIFHVLLYQPLLNALVFLSETLPGQDFGVAVIVLTLLIRAVFYPLSAQAIRAQKRLSTIQPKVKELQEKFKDNREKQAKAVMELYRQEKINPFSSILPILIQIPVLIAMYRVFWNGLTPEQLSTYLYGFLPAISSIDPTFLGILDLSEKSLLLAALAGALQFVQGKQMMAFAPKKTKKSATPDFSDMMRKQMTYVFPVIMVLIVSQLPAALGLYLIVTFGFSIWQQWLITREKPAA